MYICKLVDCSSNMFFHPSVSLSPLQVRKTSHSFIFCLAAITLVIFLAEQRSQYCLNVVCLEVPWFGSVDSHLHLCNNLDKMNNFKYSNG